MAASHVTVQSVISVIRRHCTSQQTTAILRDLAEIDGNASFRETIRRLGAATADEAATADKVATADETAMAGEAATTDKAVRHYYSPRGYELVYCGDRPQTATLTVENYCKWYEMWLLYPDGSLETVYFSRLDLLCTRETSLRGESPYVDHAPNPTVVARLAQLHSWHIDEQSYEMIVGRWELESKDHCRYRLEQ